MPSLIDRLLGRTRQSSAHTAKERLQFILVHDRIDLPPERLNEMKEKILAVISEFVDVAIDDVDIALRQNDRNSNMIVAEIPFAHSLLSDEERDENDDMELPLLTEKDDDDDDQPTP
ncbi:MAG: cell division topological specificity factor MinE [Anaerolineaceae bacterium]|nr:MAG: cell division topological specificity factor MinE [Anaerolineaceae bacterium]